MSNIFHESEGKIRRTGFDLMQERKARLILSLGRGDVISGIIILRYNKNSNKTN